MTTRTGDYVVRLSSSDAGLLGIDRDAEHANTRAAAEAGVGAQVVDYRPDLGMLVITFLPGEALTNESIGAPGVIPRAADAIRRLHAGPRFTGDFDMFTRQAGYLALVREHGFSLPAGVPFSDDFSWKFVNYAPIVTLGALLLLTVWWKTSAKSWFTGPKHTIDKAVLEAFDD